MTSIADIRDTAGRALDRANKLIGDAIEAKLEWSFRTTLTNALRRDAAKARAEGWEDVEELAKWVLARTSPQAQAAEEAAHPMHTGIVLGKATVCVLMPDPEREMLNDQIDRYATALKTERATVTRLRNILQYRDRVIRSVRARLGAQIIALTNDVQALAEAFEKLQRDLTSAREYGIRRDRAIERLAEDFDRITTQLMDEKQSATAWHRIAEEYRAEAVKAEGLLTTIAEEAESLNLALRHIGPIEARTRTQNIHGLAVSIEVNRGG